MVCLSKTVRMVGAEFLTIVMIGKKNLEVRATAVNKGEIVKRILYLNPDTEFIFCAGDDKVRLHSERLIIAHPDFLLKDRRRHVPRAPALPAGPKDHALRGAVISDTH
jgi:hypothetical protein